MRWTALVSVLCLAYFCWISNDVDATSKGHQEIFESEDPDVDHNELRREERSPDYGAGLGGPLAANSGPTPTKAPKPAPSPVVAPTSNKGHPGQSNFGDQCQAVSKTASRYVAQVDKKPRRILKAIRDGDDKPNEYLLLRLVMCTDDEKCQDACHRESCNYYFSYQDRSKSNLAFLYIVHEDILSNEENYVDSDSFDSYALTFHLNNGQTNKRPKRQLGLPTPCSPCSLPAYQLSSAQQSYCNFFCTGNKNLLGLILGLSVGLGVGLGVGAGAPLAASKSAAAQAQQAQAQAQAQSQAQQAEQFHQFQNTYSKSYENSQQQQQAQQNFQQNQQNMERSNQQNQKADDSKQGVTKFADISFATFAAFYRGALTDGPIQPTKYQPPLKEIKPTPLPKYHWETDSSHNMPPVRNQGQCGSCYAFSTSDLVATQNSIERARVLKDTATQQLAVQYAIDCGGENASVGCKGGRPAVLMRNLQRSDGIPYESCYKYKEEAGKCQKENAEKCCRRQKVKFSQLIDISGPREKEIFANLLNWGPVIAIVNANEQWMFYNGSGIIKSRQCDSKEHNHAVIVTGYNYNSSETNTSYYSIRNSWGNDWGRSGYTKIEAGKNTCGVANYVLVTCTGDCRNVTSVKDLINRTNIPQKHLDKYAAKAKKAEGSDSENKKSNSADVKQKRRV